MLQASFSRFGPSRRARAALAALALAAVAPGCSEDGGVPPMQTYPVKGSVKLGDGKPLGSGVVVFALPEQGLEFSAPVSPDGSFELKSSYGDGAPEGTYKVRIERDPASPDSQLRAGRKAPAPPYPARYADENTSGLTAVVTPSPNDLKPFVLTR